MPPPGSCCQGWQHLHSSFSIWESRVPTLAAQLSVCLEFCSLGSHSQAGGSITLRTSLKNRCRLINTHQYKIVSGHMTIHNVSACIWLCLGFQSMEVPTKPAEPPSRLLVLDQQLSACHERGGRKGKEHAIPSLLVQRAAAAQLLAWVCGSPLMRLLPIMVFCVLQHEISCSDLSHCLVRSENAFIQKSCSFLNNVTAPVLDCILNLARRWVQGSCCPFTRS